MRRYGFPFRTLAVMIFWAFFCVAADAQAGPSFTEVYDHLDLKLQTKFSVKEYMRSQMGTKVTWSGEVKDVVGGRNRVEITLANDARPTIKGFNIVLVIPYDTGGAAKLRRGQTASFSGLLHNYRNGRHGGVVIYLREGSLR